MHFSAAAKPTPSNQEQLTMRRSQKKFSTSPIRKAALCTYETLESRRMFSVSLALSGPQTITPGPTINVSADNSFGQSGMELDVNPKNPLNIAGVSQHAGGMNEIDVYRS